MTCHPVPPFYRAKHEKAYQMTNRSRAEWRKLRLRMETRNEKHSPLGGRENRHWAQFSALVHHFGRAIKLFGLYRRGVRNALDIGLTRIELPFNTLPAEFDGFRVLQLSDLHFDGLPGTMEAASKIISGLEVDLCVLTGDYCQRIAIGVDRRAEHDDNVESVGFEMHFHRRPVCTPGRTHRYLIPRGAVN